MTMIYRKALSFVRRSYMLQMSYKFEFFLRLFFMFFNILTYYFVAKLIASPYRPSGTSSSPLSGFSST